MELSDFTMVDGGVLAITVVSGILAYSRGLTREIFAIGGWILAALAAFYLAPVVEPVMREAPVVGSFLESSCVFSMIAAFTIIVALGLLILSVFTPLASSLILGSPLAPVDRALGFVFGVARGLVLIAIAYVLYQTLGQGQTWEPLENAYSKVLFDESARLIEQYVPSQVPQWFGERVDALMAPCGVDLSNTTTAPETSAPTTITPNGQSAPATTGN